MKKFIMFAALVMGLAVMVMLSGLTFSTPVSFVILAVAVSGDFLTTYLCLRAQGKEGNPAVAFLFKRIGIGGTFMVMVGIWGLFIAFRWLPSSLGAQTAVALVYWIVPVNNTVVLRRLNKRNHAAVNS
jgi:phosphatidylglycerophosphate synthase